MIRTIGGGVVGDYPRIVCYPDSTFATELAALEAAKTQIDGSKCVNFTFAANWQVTSPANDALPDGMIIEHDDDTVNTYILTVELWGYTDIAGTWRSAKGYLHLPYTSGSAPSLQEQANLNGSTYFEFEGGSAGIGAVVAVDEPSGYVSLLL